MGIESLKILPNILLMIKSTSIQMVQVEIMCNNEKLTAPNAGQQKWWTEFFPIKSSSCVGKRKKFSTFHIIDEKILPHCIWNGQWKIIDTICGHAISMKFETLFLDKSSYKKNKKHIPNWMLIFS